MRIFHFWSLKDLAEITKARQENEFDANIIVSGARGNGKSTLIWKFLRMHYKWIFKPWIHQVYDRREVMDLLENQTRGVIFDDEAIRSGYKRNFQDKGQKILIQMLNMYRDHYNVYCACCPKFFAIDKDLRDLFKIHIFIVQRGLAVIHCARDDALYSDDPWDTKYNMKIEDSWGKRKLKNPDYIPPYHKLSTFVAYLKFGDMRPKEEALYKLIKHTKRKKIYETQMKTEMGLIKDRDTEIFENVYKLLLERKLTRERIDGVSVGLGILKNALITKMNEKLEVEGYKERVRDFLVQDPEKEKLKEIAKNRTYFGYRKV